jgi:hypothetical protein
MVNNLSKSNKLPKKTSATKLLRQGIKTVFTNHLRTLGFEQEKVKDSNGRYLFRRNLVMRHDLVDVQFDKNNLPEFVINFGSVSPKGIVDDYGRTIPAKEVRYYMLVDRGRLYRSRFLIFGKWFRVSKFNTAVFGAEVAVDKEINFAIHKFQQLDDWFNKGIIDSCLIIDHHPENAPYATKHVLMEKGLWPPEGWEEDDKME